MKAISVRQQDKLNELVIELSSRAEEVRDAIHFFNDAVAGPLKGLEITFDTHNIAAAALKGLLIDLAMTADAYLGERSERWPESDTGAAYAEWAQSLAEAADSIHEIDADEFLVEELCEPELSDADSWTYPANAPGA
jgi:hypothetical protein